MMVLRAAEMGMCFGVRDALAVLDAVAAPMDVTIHGELVHNHQVLDDLAARGFVQSDEQARPVPATPVVLVTAHGVSERERARLTAHGKRLVDTTCPLVAKAHAAAQALQAEGRRIVVIGRQAHVEVRGIVEDLRDPIVVGDARDVRCWSEPRLGVVCQTTTQATLAEAVVDAIRAANPRSDIRFVDTICSPTKARIASLDVLLPLVDGVVVVGGLHSNNTKQLAARVAAAGVPVMHIENAAGIAGKWLRGKRVIGLTAGTSTLDVTIDEVERALRGAACLT
ncbi:MAG: 4-hydroxy-3-methylbut-2-enyl diphosphate reductase [Planctomycetes bacterium]|nr:4-hydroxy-3-methylbut-2-enyl diphosphate reductase [Planctomycetota bacterium]